MKKLILIVSLLAPVPVYANHCGSGNNNIVKYTIFNQSDYRISLDFDEARHGQNPDDNSIAVVPNHGFRKAYGCSKSFFRGYEARAILRTHGRGVDVELSYLYIYSLFSHSGRFSYEAYNIKSPKCACKVGVGEKWFDVWTEQVEYFDCSSYTGSMKKYAHVHISCK